MYKSPLFNVGLVVFCFSILISGVLASHNKDSADVKVNTVSVGSFKIDVPKKWTPFASGDAAQLTEQYLEQSRQIYQNYTGADDPAKAVQLAAFHIPGADGSFVIVSFKMPPQADLIELLKSQVDDKMAYGIRQGFIRKYFGMVSVDENQLKGFYTRAIGGSGNVQIGGGIEHEELKNTMLQLTLLAPDGWSVDEASSVLSKILKSVKLKKK